MPHIPKIKAFPLTGFLLLLSLTLPAATGSAAAVPDAGSILRDQQQAMPRARESVAPPEEATGAPSNADDGTRVGVRGFTFSGYEGLASEAELKAMVAPAIGKSLSFGELQRLADTVTAAFRAKGFNQAKAYLPSQDITAGIIHIAVTQVKSDGKVTVRRDRTARISEDLLRGIASKALNPGQPINEGKLRRAILLMNDLPGVSAKASIVSGKQAGASGLEVDVAEGPVISGTVTGDNQGNRYTGTWRATATLSVNDPLHRGDQISMLLTESSGLAQGRVGYSFPIGFDGIRANLAYTGMRYELGQELADLQYKGNGNIIDAGVSYPVVRSSTANLTVNAAYGYRSLVDSKSDIDIRNRQVNSATISINGDRYDRFNGGGYSTFSLGVTTGRLHESIADISLTGAEGGYARYNAGLSRLQRITEQLSLTIAGTAQFAGGNLDSSEKMSLGGPGGVRAYPVGEASGDDGQLLSAELRYSLPLPPSWGRIQLSGFYDAGHITLNHDRYSGDVVNATDSNDYWLQGAGIGLNCWFSSRASVRASWAHAIGENAGRNTDGNNTDGRADKSRFWLQGVVYF